MNVSSDFSKGGIGGHILHQSIPLMAAQILQLLYNVVDRIYIGHIPGTDGLALTGIGLVFPIISLVAAFTNLYGMGGAPLCSIARGAGEKEEAQKLLGNSAVLLFFTSLVLTVAILLIKRPMLYLLGASDDTYPYANVYLSIYILGTLFVMLGTGLNNFITVQGFPKTAMMTTFFGAILNLILDPIFIFVFHFGIAGAAVATVIAQFASCIWVLRFLTGKKPELTIRREDFALELARVKRITTLGLSGFIMSATNGLAQVACNAMLGIYGGDLYIGIMTVLNSIREIISLPISGITSGAQPVIGFNFGAKKNDRVRSGIRFMTFAGGLYALVSWALLLLFPRPFLSLFTSSQEMVDAGVRCVHLYFAGYIFMLFQFCGQSSFIALGKSKRAIFFSLFRKVIIVVPLTLWLPHTLSDGVVGVRIAEPISNLIGGLACYTTMFLTVYRRLDSR